MELNLLLCLALDIMRSFSVLLVIKQRIPPVESLGRLFFKQRRILYPGFLRTSLLRSGKKCHLWDLSFLIVFGLTVLSHYTGITVVNLDASHQIIIVNPKILEINQTVDTKSPFGGNYKSEPREGVAGKSFA